MENARKAFLAQPQLSMHRKNAFYCCSSFAFPMHATVEEIKICKNISISELNAISTDLGLNCLSSFKPSYMPGSTHFIRKKKNRNKISEAYRLTSDRQPVRHPQLFVCLSSLTMQGHTTMSIRHMSVLSSDSISNLIPHQPHSGKPTVNNKRNRLRHASQAADGHFRTRA